MSEKISLVDRAGTVVVAICLLALSLMLLSGAVLLAFMAYSTADCEFNPKSERCVALHEREFGA